MTVRHLALMGHPVLLTPAAPVVDVAAPEVQELIDDMLATMAAADGIGLAAPQVHRSLRIIVALEIRDRAERDAGIAHVLVNPGADAPGRSDRTRLRGLPVDPGPAWPRAAPSAASAFRAIDRAGAAVEGVADGLFARVLQHEVDHLDGILYPMRMTDLRHLAFTSELPQLTAWLDRDGDAQ